MASSLGKRRRTLREIEVELPVKRARRSAKVATLLERDEDGVDLIVFDDGNKENEAKETASGQTVATQQPQKQRRALVSLPNTNAKNFPITPSTPRHRDALANNPKTPVSRHRVMSAGRLFRRGTPLTPVTPLTPGSAQTVYHQARKLFSRNAEPGKMVGREEERAQLSEFAARFVGASPHGFLYVSGPPGTGKSAMVREVTDDVVGSATGHEGAVCKAYINCMSIKSAKDLYTTLLALLGCDDGVSEKEGVSALQKMFTTKTGGDTYLVILDEIDHIVTLDLDSLYRLIEWSLQRTSRLLLVGIANALDLTDRFLPRLKARNLKAELLPFMPYDVTQVRSIITARLKGTLPATADCAESPVEDSFVPFMDPAAIDLCARKVCAQTGDLRRAFDLCRRAIELAEQESRQKLEAAEREREIVATPSSRGKEHRTLPLGESTIAANKAALSPPTTPVSSSSSASVRLVAALQCLTPVTAPRATREHVLRAAHAVFTASGANQRLRALNLQQRAALCALAALERRARDNAAQMKAQAELEAETPSKKGRGRTGPSGVGAAGKQQQCGQAPTVKAVYAAYRALCTRGDGGDSVLHPLSASEFREVLGSLEALGLVGDVAAGDKGKGGMGLGGGLGTSRGRKSTAGTMSGGLFSGRASAAAAALGDERRIASCVDEKELETAVEGPGGEILQLILSGEALE